MARPRHIRRQRRTVVDVGLVLLRCPAAVLLGVRRFEPPLPQSAWFEEPRRVVGLQLGVKTHQGAENETLVVMEIGTGQASVWVPEQVSATQYP